MNEALTDTTKMKKKEWGWVHAIYGSSLEVAGGLW